MDEVQKAKWIDQFLKSLYRDSTPKGLNGQYTPIDKRISPKDVEEIQEILEKLDLVVLEQGGSNTTISGENHYKISQKGKRMVRREQSCFEQIIKLVAQESLADVFGSNYQQIGNDLEKQQDQTINKRVEKAELYFQMAQSEGLIDMDKEDFKKHFQNWAKKDKVDLQVKNGDFVIENGDLQMVSDNTSDNTKEDFGEFLKIYNDEKEELLKYMKKQGVKPKPDKNHKLQRKRLIIAVIVALIAAAGLAWKIYSEN